MDVRVFINTYLYFVVLSAYEPKPMKEVLAYIVPVMSDFDDPHFQIESHTWLWYNCLDIEDSLKNVKFVNLN